MLSQRQVEDVCLAYQGAGQCRYLEGDPLDWKKLYCRKLTPDRKIIDEVVEEFLHNHLLNGTDPFAENTAIGDNCKGYICFKSKIQGYDLEE